jgi:hypothetical protein
MRAPKRVIAGTYKRLWLRVITHLCCRRGEDEFPATASADRNRNSDGDGLATDREIRLGVTTRPAERCGQAGGQRALSEAQRLDQRVVDFRSIGLMLQGLKRINPAD